MALGRQNKKAAQRLWRPDFRDVQVLPDTKIIRTGFLLNFVAIAITLALIMLYLFKEYSLQSITQSVNSLERQVAESTPENRAVLDANKRFKQSAAIMEEVIAFDRQVVDYPVFIRELSSVLPMGVLLNELDMRSSQQKRANNVIAPLSVELTGVIVGSTSETPSQILTQFQDSIRELPSVAGQDLEMDLRQFQRNNELGNFSFTLQVLIHAESASK